MTGTGSTPNNDRAPVATAICIGQGCYTPLYGRGDQRYCSNRCRNLAYRMAHPRRDTAEEQQATLFDPPRFDGKSYDPALDEDRLSKQLGRVYDLMADGGWRTLSRIRLKCGGSEAGVSARLRDLRKRKFGEYTVDRRRVLGADGLWEYSLRRGS